MGFDEKETGLIKTHWTNLTKGKFNVKLCPEMLTSLKHYRKITTHTKGSGYLQLKETYEVEFDRDYVLHKIITEIFKPLGIRRWDVMLNILCEAFELWRKENDE